MDVRRVPRDSRPSLASRRSDTSAAVRQFLKLAKQARGTTNRISGKPHDANRPADIGRRSPCRSVPCAADFCPAAIPPLTGYTGHIEHTAVNVDALDRAFRVLKDSDGLELAVH